MNSIVKLHLVDVTYELFRSHYSRAPAAYTPSGRPVKATKMLIQTLLLLLKGEDVTYVGCAFDRVVESFRNKIFSGYKTGSGIPEDLKSQFSLVEQVLQVLGLVKWSMVEFEADDAIASAVCRWAAAVDKVVICSPDKDFAQLVCGEEIVVWDRRRDIELSEEGVREKFGVDPESMPDLLALVGDSADGIPGIPRWGQKTASSILSEYGKIEKIPSDSSDWIINPRGAKVLSKHLEQSRMDAMLYKSLTTLRTDVPINECLCDLEWHGVKRKEYLSLCDELGFERLKNLPHRWDNREIKNSSSFSLSGYE